MSIEASNITVKPVERPLNLIPVGLKEAALDSPTFRATAVHFSEQIDAIERWLDGYTKAASKLSAEIGSVETLVNAFLAQAVPPAQISEAVLDHDYALLAAQRYAKGARDFWHSILRGIKRYDTSIIEPVRNFVQNELRAFKEARRGLDASQRSYDSVVSRYMAQNKSKEASSLREDAFQLHEARKAYLKASMDFCISAPQVRTSLDKLVVRISSEQWRDVQTSREANATLFTKWSSDMERVRGWSREMENSERAFKRELLTARQQIEASALNMTRPSRDMDDYAIANVAYLAPAANSPVGSTDSQISAALKAEKQGWLFLRTVSGKPARTTWSRRWFYVKNGIFGWLVQGSRSGGVEESEKIGVLLCGVRPSPQEERRFCFEVKTKDTSVILQAETQQELSEWISAFEHAKRRALDNPLSTEALSTNQGVDPAFAITAPVAPEFAAKLGDSHGLDEGLTVSGVPDSNSGNPQARTVPESMAARRVMSIDKDREGEGSRDHAARIIQKLDIHKRSTTNPASQPSPGIGGGGIASLISASHNVLPVGPGPSAGDAMRKASQLSSSTLAPSSLANPPAPTNLSHTAVVISSERGINLGRTDGSGTPGGVMANLWGSSHWGYVNRLGDDLKSEADTRSTSASSSPALTPSVTQDDVGVMDGMGSTFESSSAEKSLALDEEGGPRHRKTISVGNERFSASEKALPIVSGSDQGFPASYPAALKTQQAQFRMLFPNVSPTEKVVMVFRASWNPNEQQEFPGRVYVTEKEIYFFSNHLGFVLITGVHLKATSEVTAAPGRDCDYLYLHLKERNQQDDRRRVTVKVFLEPLRLLQRRLSYLVRNADAERPDELETIMKTLIKMETEPLKRSSSAESWEDLAYDGDEADSNEQNRNGGQSRRERNIKASLRIDGALYADPAKTGREIQKFKLPSQPVAYTPQGMQAGVTRDFNVSAKALFHVMFGDKSAVFQLLYANRWADKIVQTPWTKSGEGSHWRRSFSSQQRAESAVDVQTIDIMNDHLCYSITNAKNPWRLPYSSRFLPTTKIVITHTAKSRSKLAIFQQVVWQQPPSLKYIERIIERQALGALEADALDLTNVAMDQVAKLGHHSKTNRAIEIFGGIGQLKQAPQIDAAAVSNTATESIGLPPRGIQPKPTKLARLVLDDVLFKALGLLGWILDVSVAVGKTVLNACSAHSILLAMLAVSALYNGWYGYRESLTWYEERRASNFMTRLGVVPEPVLSKAVYLSDIEELVGAPEFKTNRTAISTTSCRSRFREQLNAPAGGSRLRLADTRVQRSRASLARSRHDLLVALRVLNRVEKDVVSAAWEDHLRGEQEKCSRVERMLHRYRSSSDNDTLADLGEDFAEYCQSCKTELEAVNNEAKSSLLL